MQKITPIYEFSVNEKTEKEVQKTKIIDEKEVKVLEKETVETPVKFLFKKPGRRDEEEGELFYASRMHELVNKYSLLTRAMLINKYRDSGGLVSEETEKEVSKVLKRYIELDAEIPVLRATSKKTKKQKEKLETLEQEFVSVQKQFADLQSYKESLFSQCADDKARNDLLRWYAINFSYVQKEDDDEPSSYFSGDNFEEKLDDYFEKEDQASDFYKAAGEKLGLVSMIWFFHRPKTAEDFKKLVEEAEKLK